MVTAIGFPSGSLDRHDIAQASLAAGIGRKDHAGFSADNPAIGSGTQAVAEAPRPGNLVRR